jgi:hypothetical protein
MPITSGLPSRAPTIVPGDCLDQIARPEPGDEVGEHLGVGVGAEHDAVVLELLPQLEMVLDHTVVDDGKISGLVEMRMGIPLGGRSVRGPAGVADPAHTRQRFVVEGPRQFGDPAGSLADMDPGVIDRRDPRAVVAAVLEPTEALQEDRDDVERAGEGDDAAHGRILWGGEGTILQADWQSGSGAIRSVGGAGS